MVSLTQKKMEKHSISEGKENSFRLSIRKSISVITKRVGLYLKLVYLNGNNAAEGENNINFASSYPMN